MIKTDRKPTNPEYLNRNTYSPNRTVTCEKCGAVLYYESISDTHVGEFGARYITCPYCDDEILTEEEGITITVDNLEEEYFTDFTKGVEIDFDKVKNWIKIAVKHLEQNHDESYYLASSGNSFVCVFRDDGEECDYSVLWCPYGYKEVELKKRFQQVNYEHCILFHCNFNCYLVVGIIKFCIHSIGQVPL